MSDGVAFVERRKQSSHLAREMFIRAQDWSALELCAVLDIVGSRIMKSEPTHGVDLLLQQFMNIVRKRPASGLENRCDRDDQPEGGGSDSPACSPEVRG